MLYFRHDDWETLCAPLVEKLSMDTFQRIEQVSERCMFSYTAGSSVRVARGSRNSTSTEAWLLICTPVAERHRREAHSELETTSRQCTWHPSSHSALPHHLLQDAYRPGQSINQILQTAFQILTYEKVHSRFPSDSDKWFIHCPYA